MKEAKTHGFDYSLSLAIGLLLILGILILASVSAVFSQEKVGNTSYYLMRQLIRGVLVGIILAIVLFITPLSRLKKWGLIAVVINLIFMGLVFAPKIGIAAGGASRWIKFGPINFQPSEFLKLTFIFYLALWLANRTQKPPKDSGAENRGGWKLTLLPFLIILGVVALLLFLQSDLSTLGIIIFVALIMYFSARTPVWQSALIILLLAGTMLSLIVFEPYRMERVLIFLGIKDDPMGMGYQVKQALIAIGSGGISGLGLGMSQQKFGFIPQPMSDSIFAIFAEELGFAGSFALIFLFIFLFWRGVRIFKNTKEDFSRLLTVGIVSWICVQAFINIGSIAGIFPLVGIPLPFVSHGGSHIIAELAGVGILLNVSKFARK